MTKKRALITGINGMDGSHLADLLLEKDYEVFGLERRTTGRERTNLVHIEDEINFLVGDLTDQSSLLRAVKESEPHELYNLAAQSFVGKSWSIPEQTSNVTGLGVLRVLEAIRECDKDIKFYQASSSEMFGNTTNIHFPGKRHQYHQLCETDLFQPRSPYGVAKLYGHWITRNYRESYGMFNCSGILFNHECFFSETPVIVRRNGEIDIVYVSSLIPNRKDLSKDSLYLEKDYSNLEHEIWDGESFVKLLTVSRKKLFALEEKNQKKRIVNTRNGCVGTTPNHKLCVMDGNEYLRLPSDSVVEGNKLKIGNFPNLNEQIKLTEEYAELLGMICGDGHISSRGDSLRFTNNDEVLRSRFIELCEKTFCKFTFEIKTYESGYGVSTHVNASGINSGMLAAMRNMLYEKHTKHKKVPMEILNTDKNCQRAFLRGYYVCDGLKKDKCRYEFKSFKTNSSLLAQGLLFLFANQDEQQTFNLNVFFQNGREYQQVNLHSPAATNKGKYFKKERDVLKKIIELDDVDDQHVFDIETETRLVMAGVGRLVVSNSERRGIEFVTRKITDGVAKIELGLAEHIALGNLEAKRDWGYAPDYVRAMWLMLQSTVPDDYVIATGRSHSIREFLDAAFKCVGIDDWAPYVVQDARYMRPAEVDVLCGDASKAKLRLGWTPETTFEALVEKMVESDIELNSRKQNR